MRYVATLGLYAGLSAFGVAAGSILKPSADYRDFRYYQLNNGMRAIAVHHPRSTEAGFSVAAKTGSLYDPADIPGLAHFLEHMLFLGTEKYPDPESYDSFLTENGGSNNAYTDEEKTVFYNKVTDSAFEEALDRFSEFFKKPLFNPEFAEKEVNAIEAEHQKNIPNDDERAWYTIRSQANGPMSRFATGSTATLSTLPKENGIDVVGRLHDFHSQYYCGSNMVAVTISPRSLDEQESLVRTKFEGVSSGRPDWLGMVQCPGPEFDQVKPFDNTNTGKFVHLQSFSSEPSLWVTFGLPPTLTTYKKQPMSVLTYMLEYTGKGSLSQRLRMLGLADGISSVSDRNSVSTLFGLKVDLTQKGAKNRGLVLQEVFSYINFLRDHGISHEIVSTLAEQSHIDFHTTQPNASVMDEVSRLAHNLLTYEPYHVVAGDSLLMDADPRLANQLLQQMSPSRSIIAFSDPSFTSKVQDFTTDPYYGVQFKVMDLPAHHAVAMAVLTATKSTFHVPPPLMHIPTAEELRILPNLQGMTQPELLQQGEGESGMSMWWQGQGTFAVPKIAVQLIARIPKTKADVFTQAQASVALSTIAERLQEETVDFQNCGIAHSLTFTSNGYHLSFEGYSAEQMRKIMGLVAERLQEQTVDDEDRFERIKSQKLKLLGDPATNMAFQHAMEAADILTRNDAYNRVDLIQAVRDITFEESMATFANLKDVHVDAFVMGNIGREDSADLVETFISRSGFNLIEREDASTSLAMEQKQTIDAVLANPIKGDKNHATLIQFQLGIPTIEERVNLAVLTQFINRRLYDNLRTEAQLGYIVGAKEASSANVEELQCFVEGSKSHPDEVIKMIDAELGNAKKHLDSISDSELEHWKESTRAKLSRQDINFAEEYGRSWGEIFTHGNCFIKRGLELKYLEKDFSAKRLAHTFAQLVDPTHRLTVKLIAGLDPDSEVTLIGAPQKSGGAVLNQQSQHAATPTKLASLEDKFVSRVQEENGFFPDVTVCEAQPSFVSQFELMEEL